MANRKRGSIQADLILVPEEMKEDFTETSLFLLLYFIRKGLSSDEHQLPRSLYNRILNGNNSSGDIETLSENVLSILKENIGLSSDLDSDEDGEACLDDVIERTASTEDEELKGYYVELWKEMNKSKENDVSFNDVKQDLPVIINELINVAQSMMSGFSSKPEIIYEVCQDGLDWCDTNGAGYREDRIEDADYEDDNHSIWDEYKSFSNIDD